MADDGIIGSVGVSVVPDASDFWRRFQEQTKAKAVKAGEQSGRDWERGFDAATRDTSVRVRADTTEARAQIAALNRDGSKNSKGLLASLLPLAPALVPIAGAATLGTAALASMGVQGILAVKGVQAAMKSSTAEGLQFAAGVNTIKGDLSELEATAAHNVMGAFGKSVTQLHAAVPALNADLAQSSKILGTIGGHLLSAAVGGEHTFAPALLQAETSVDKLAGRFESWATGPGGAQFAATLSRDFATVEPVIEDVAGAVSHLVGAVNGPGLGAVAVIDDIAKGLDAIPTPVLTTLVEGIVALKAVGVVTALFDKFAVSVRGAAVAEREAAVASTGLRGGLATGVGLLGKTAAGWIGVSLATGAAANATNDWASNSDDAKRKAGQTIGVLNDLAHFNFKGAGSDLFGPNRQAQEQQAAYTKQVQTALFNQAMHYNEVQYQTVKKQGNNLLVVAGVGSLSKSLMATTGATKNAAAAQTIAAQIQASYAKYTDQTTVALNREAAALSLTASSGKPVSALAGDFQTATTAIQKHIDATQKFLTLGGQTVETYHGMKIGVNTYQAALQQTGGDVEKASGLIHAQVDSLSQQKLALAQTSAEQQRLGQFVSDVGTKYALTADQVDSYSSALGLNFDKIAQSGQALKTAEAEFGTFVGLIKNGTTAVQGWATAVDTFNSSGKTAADRGQLLSAALVSFNGDAIAYGSTMANVSTANQQLVTDLKNAHKGIIDLKTGTIDFHNAGAAPLLNDLQQLQTLSANAAAATYQHELATKGSKVAMQDAVKVYQSDTRGALIDEFTKLTGNATAAKKLADRYLGLPKDVQTKIEALNAPKTDDLLNAIGQQLAYLTHHPWKFTVDADTSPAKAKIAKLMDLGGGTYRVKGSSTGLTLMADGGIITQGTGPRADDVLIRASKGEAVIPADQTSKHLGLVNSLINGTQGFESGGFVGVDFSGNANKNGVVKRGSGSKASYVVNGQSYASLRAADNAASRLFKADVTLGLKIDTTDIGKFKTAIKGTADQVHVAFEAMIADAKKLGVSGVLSHVLSLENTQLEKDVAARDKAADQLKAVQQKIADETATVKSAATGGFDLASSGTGFDGQQPVTFANINAQATQENNIIKAWAAGIKKLGAEGFNKSATGKAMLQRLAEDGPGDYPEVRALLSASPKQLASLISTQASINAQGAGLGSYIANDLYGGQASKLAGQVAIDQRSINALAARMEKQLEKAVREVAGRPIEIKVDGKVIARVAAAGAKKNARRS